MRDHMCFNYSADFIYLDSALKDRWQTFMLLNEEIVSFVPRPISDYSQERDQYLAQLQIDNPNVAIEELESDADYQISALASHQMYYLFDKRIMNEYVTVIMLSSALCEAMINAILAIGLTENKTPEIFSLLERANLLEKWVVGPKSFNPNYRLDKSGCLYETLKFLIKQRNALVHYKITLEVGQQKMITGSDFESMTIYVKEIRWLHRFLSLPYDLAAHTRTQLTSIIPLSFFYRDPITVASEHIAK